MAGRTKHQSSFRAVSDEAEGAAKVVIDCAFRVHSTLGPGVLESVYERCLAYEIRKVGHHCERQVSTPVIYDGHEVGDAFVLDLLVDNCLIVELKAVEAILPVHEAQLLSYLRLTD